MNKNKLTLLNIFILGGLMMLGGCVSTEKNTEPKVAKIDFNLPQQIKWKQIKNQQKAGNTLAEWIPVANKENSSSPVRIVYQRLLSNKSAKEFLSDAAKPLQKVCKDISASPFPNNSNYKDKVSIEVLCSRLGKAGFGTVSYLTAYSDGQANYFLMSEVKLPASKKAGLINPKNEQEKKWAVTAAELAKVMQKFNQNTRFCDTTGQCK